MLATLRRYVCDRTAVLSVVALVLGAPIAVTDARQTAVRSAVTPGVVAMPNRDDALRFAVLGDFGTGEPRQYQMAEQMVKTHASFPYEIVILVGDNIYGAERPQDMRKKFELPYKPLLDAKVKFYAALGNHDSREQRYYKPFNMDGHLYFSFKAPKEDVRFFVLESTYPEPAQIKWLEEELKQSREKWKIPYFHHPLYSSGEYHGSDVRLRRALEPLFIKYGVTVVFTGHDHIYERVKPQQGVTYFVVGSGGELRPGNLDKKTGLTAQANDTDNAFLIAEIKGEQLNFQAISRTGAIIDSGVITRRNETENP
jgi:predicted MPP superfamily phosphohydrolase